MKKGSIVVMLGFTGMLLGEQEVSAATKDTLTILKKNGDELVFDKKTGLQLNANNAKYANKVVHPEDAPEAKPKKTKVDKIEASAKESKATAKKTVTKKTIKSAIIEDDEDEYEEA